MGCCSSDEVQNNPPEQTTLGPPLAAHRNNAPEPNQGAARVRVNRQTTRRRSEENVGVKDLAPMTREELTRMRAEYWDTRVEGMTEMWQTLKMAYESDDVGTRDVIIQTSGLERYRGDTKELHLNQRSEYYQYRGFLYEVPEYIFRKPSMKKEEKKSAKTQKSKPQRARTQAEVEAESKEIQISLRLSRTTNGIVDNIFVKTTRGETIEELLERVEKEKGPPPKGQVAIVMFQGKRLVEYATLNQMGIPNKRVLQVFYVLKS